MHATIRFGLALLPWLGMLAPALADPVPLEATLALISQAQIEGHPLQYDRMRLAQDRTIDEMNFTTSALARSSDGTAQSVSEKLTGLDRF